MTKFKEYLRSKGIKLECDYEVSHYNIIGEVATLVLNNGVTVGVYYDSTGYLYTAYNRAGECSRFYDFGVYIEELHYYDFEYKDFLNDTGCNKFFGVFEAMEQLYLRDAKTRIAFKHMKAGIMDKEVFYRWISNRCQKYVYVGI